MAIPTDFGDSTPVAGTSTTFPIPGTAIVGIDDGGALTPTVVQLAPNATILMDATVTDAALVAAMLLFLQRYGAGHDGAGGFPSRPTLQVAASLTTCT